MNIIASRVVPVPTPLTEADLCGWIGRAAPGDILEYHRGFLALDTMPPVAGIAAQGQAELARVARRAWWAARQGLIDLVQRRHGTGDYSYLAIARTKPRTARVALSSLRLPGPDRQPARASGRG